MGGGKELKTEKKSISLIKVIKGDIKKLHTENITRVYRNNSKKRNSSKIPQF